MLGLRHPLNLDQGCTLMFNQDSCELMGGGLPFRKIQFQHLNQSLVEPLICHLADRHASPLGHGQKGLLDVGVDCD